MNEAALPDRQSRPAVEYLRLSFGSLWQRSTILPAALLLLALTGTNIIALLNQPLPGSPLPAPFIAATLIRIAALLLLSTAILRLAVDSLRNPWMPDGAFFLYALLFTLGLAVPGLVEILHGDVAALRTSLIANAVAVLLVSLLCAWIVAVAVERPLAWAPVPWLRRSGQWLPYRIGWGLLLLVPLGALHSHLAVVQLQATGAWFWPVAILDGVLSFLILMIRLGLDVAAYRRVAQR